ncbi:MAG: hypothetical protein HYT09_04285 [Candidatus Levybacteria bacterium]|nr:hypothetical protein [Candidatus Levybacteria bacterium]
MAKTRIRVSTSAEDRVASYVWSGAKSLPELIDVAKAAMEAEHPCVAGSYVLPNSWLNVLEELQALLKRNGVIVESVKLSHAVLEGRRTHPLEGIGLVSPRYRKMMLQAATESEILNQMFRIRQRSRTGAASSEDLDDAEIILDWLIRHGWTYERMQNDGYPDLADHFPHISA